MDFLPKLRAVADRWVAVWSLTDSDISLKTLGVRVAGNSKLFERDQMNVATFEKVICFLVEPTNWPLATLPEEARALLSRICVFPVEEDPQVDLFQGKQAA